MDKKIIDYSTELMSLFKIVQRKFRSHIIDKIDGVNCTFPQLMLMHELYHYPDITLNELSTRLGLSKSTVSGMVDRLEAQGKVSRIIPENNRRIVKLSLTTESLEKSYLIKDVNTQYIAELLEKLGGHEVEDMVILFRKFVSLVEADNVDRNRVE